jgi:hypothetical protein
LDLSESFSDTDIPSDPGLRRVEHVAAVTTAIERDLDDGHGSETLVKSAASKRDTEEWAGGSQSIEKPDRFNDRTLPTSSGTPPDGR